MFGFLEGLTWHRVSLQLINTRNTFAREPPLAIFEGVFKKAMDLPGRKLDINYVFHPAGERLSERINKQRAYSLELIFFQSHAGVIEQFLDNLRTLLADWRNNFALTAVSAIHCRSLGDLNREHPVLPEECSEICLEFLTIFPFTPKVQAHCSKERRILIDRDAFFSLLLSRVVRAFGLTEGFLPTEALWEDFRLLPYYWEYAEENHLPKSNRGDSEKINGCIGPLFIKGPIVRIFPLLLLCSEINASRKPAKGRGHYVLRQDRPFFDHLLRDPSRLKRAYEDLRLNSDLGDDLHCAIAGPEEMFMELHAQLLDGSYRPLPFHGFSVAKKSGGTRLIATAEPRDHLVQMMLHALLAETCDRMFEECSIGFRRGRSRQEAKKVVSEAVRQGFTHVLESDVEAFFDSVDWQLMRERLAALLPQADRVTLALLEKFIKAELIADGHPVERSCGLVQGMVLAPLLANIYLDTFDEEMTTLGHWMVRYGDDFLVLVRSKEEGECARIQAADILRRLRLTIKDTKTAITSLESGFTFLGFEFGPGLDEDFVEHTALRKPLFVRNLYAFLGIDSDSVIVKKDSQLLERLPINRIGEIIVFGDNTLSTRLLHRCNRLHIPVSFCQAGGKYIGTLRPDSKAYFEMASIHSRRFQVLSEMQRLAVAKLIVAAKVAGYVAWFEGRYGTAANEVCRDLDGKIASLQEVDRVESVLGHEGDAARLAYQFWGAQIEDQQTFGFEKRVAHKKCDPFNVLLDFASSLVFSRLNVLLRSQGLNPYLGFLHGTKDTFESLVCDLQEPFRARTERFLLKTINRKIIRKEHFELAPQDNSTWRMTRDGVGLFLEAFERELNVRLAGDGGTLKQLLAAQVQVVRQWVMSEEKELFFYHCRRE